MESWRVEMGPWEAKMECKCPPLRAPNGRLSSPNCEMELLEPPRWISRAARCANMAQRAIFGGIWGAQKGTKMSKLSIKNVTKWKPVMDMIWSPFLDRCGHPKETKINRNKAVK